MSNFTYTDIPSPLDQFEIRDLLSLDAPILGNLHLSINKYRIIFNYWYFFSIIY